jgi:hypothetical protein
MYAVQMHHVGHGQASAEFHRPLCNWIDLCLDECNCLYLVSRLQAIPVEAHPPLGLLSHSLAATDAAAH